MYKPKIVFLYKKSNKYFNRHHSDSQLFFFYLRALPRNDDIQLRIIAEDNEFDALDLEGKCDVLLLFDILPWGCPDVIKNLDKVSYLKILNCGDCHQASNIINGKTKIDHCREAKIDYYHWHHPESYFYKFWPRDWKYWQIQVGIEEDLYKNIKPFNDRISDKILNTGVLSKSYRLRNSVNKHSRVYHSPHRGKKSITGINYTKLLQEYKAVISACTLYTVTKYIEGSAAGCLNFMEVTPQNCGENLGFVDAESSVFINEMNYCQKFDEFISDSSNPKWMKIAKTGREFVMSHYTNNHTIAELIKRIKEVI